MVSIKKLFPASDLWPIAAAAGASIIKEPMLPVGLNRREHAVASIAHYRVNELGVLRTLPSNEGVEIPEELQPRLFGYIAGVIRNNKGRMIKTT